MKQTTEVDRRETMQRTEKLSLDLAIKEMLDVFSKYHLLAQVQLRLALSCDFWGCFDLQDLVLEY